MNIFTKLTHLILVAVLLSFSLSYAQENEPADVSDEYVLIKPEVKPVPLNGDEELKLHFHENEKAIQEQRNKLAAFGADMLRSTIFRDMYRYYAKPVSSTEIEFPMGPRLDLDKLDPDLEGKSDLKQTQLKIQKFLADQNLSAVLTEFKELNAEQLADFLVRKEAWLKSLSESVLTLMEKWKMGSRTNPKTILRVNKFIRFVNNAFYSAPLNVAYSNTFGIQVAGFNGVLGLAPGRIGEKYLGQFAAYGKAKAKLAQVGNKIEDGALLLQQLIETRLNRPHIKPWLKFNGEFGAYISVGATPAISFRNVDGQKQINLEMFAEFETYKTSLTPVLQVYVGETTGIFLEDRKTGSERLFQYVRRFVPFLAIYSKGDTHMSVVGGTSLIPNIPALVQTKSTRYYFFRLPLNEAARQSHVPTKGALFLTGLKAQLMNTCRRYFSGE